MGVRRRPDGTVRPVGRNGGLRRKSAAAQGAGGQDARTAGTCRSSGRGGRTGSRSTGTWAGGSPVGPKLNLRRSGFAVASGRVVRKTSRHRRCGPCGQRSPGSLTSGSVDTATLWSAPRTTRIGRAKSRRSNWSIANRTQPLATCRPMPSPCWTSRRTATTGALPACRPVSINPGPAPAAQDFSWGIRKGLVARTPFKVGTEPAVQLEREIPSPPSL